jgi:transcriptional regulator with GAF, ATPase, and Fis domain
MHTHTPQWQVDLVIHYNAWTRHVLLTRAPIVLGRSEDCDVQLDDERVSRRHCRLFPDGDDGWGIEDLGSRVGTFVDGRRIDGRVSLAVGRQFAIGPMQLHLQRQPFPSILSGDTPRDARTVGILLQTLDELYATSSLERVLETIVDRAMLLADLDRGAILVSGDGGHLEAAVARTRNGDNLSPDEVLSRSLPQRVMQSGEPIVVTDFAELDGERPHSVMREALRSVLCVPVPGAERPLGVLYADGRRPAQGFGPAERAVFEALALHGSLAIERVRLREEERRAADARDRRLTNEVEALRARAGDVPIGNSPAMRATLDILRRVAGSDATILVTGETGTGKEVLARYVHRLSRRAKAPFVVVDCGAIPEGLVESELFGHERGAFTGATTASQGRFREADGGTVFLDEIGELPLLLQTRLLRVLQEKTVQPIGAKGRLPVDVRVICATHQDLADRAKNNLFRQDLFYRISVLPVPVPALRDRGEDIELLAQHFLGRFAAVAGVAFTGFTREARDTLLGHSWPGNVRELENRVHRAAILAQPPYVTRSDLGLAESDAMAVAPAEFEVTLPSLQQARADATVRFEKHYLHEVLRRTGGNVTHAAHLAGVTRGLLQRMLREHAIDRSAFVSSPGEPDEEVPV